MAWPRVTVLRFEIHQDARVARRDTAHLSRLPFSSIRGMNPGR